MLDAVYIRAEQRTSRRQASEEPSIMFDAVYIRAEQRTSRRQALEEPSTMLDAVYIRTEQRTSRHKKLCPRLYSKLQDDRLKHHSSGNITRYGVSTNGSRRTRA